MIKSVTLEPIGLFHCSKKNPYEAPRQASIDPMSSEGIIELIREKNFEQALEGLSTFSHIWIIYEFHQNQNWKPKVLPPRGSTQKIGVLATRSPYRPNPIGMSCVELIKIEKRKIFVKNHDLLDETPILDIKPYLAYADSFPLATQGWIKSNPFTIRFTNLAQDQIHFLKDHGITELEGFLRQQLGEDPTNSKKKRVSAISENQFVIAYRTWRISFFILDNLATIENIFSGYANNDLQTIEDHYLDKKIHIEFKSRFTNIK